MDKIVLIEYEKEFINNLSNYIYAQALENKGYTCYYKNITNERINFEDKMKNLNLKCKFLSPSRLKFDKVISNKNITIESMLNIDESVLSSLKFTNLNFLLNYDILEEIKQTNSIGFYLNENDINELSIEFLTNALKRLNKYLIKPKLFIFSKSNFDIPYEINYKFINIKNKNEEFYLLKNCKHKIIANLGKSQKVTFLASLINKNDCNYVAYESKFAKKVKYKNWIKI